MSEVPGGSPALRVGLVLHGLDVPAWAEPVVDRLLAGPGLSLSIVFTTGAPARREGPGFRAYQRFDRRFLGLRPDPQRLLDLRERLARVECVALEERALPAEQAAAIAALDLVVDLTRGTPIAGLDQHARRLWHHPLRDAGGAHAALGFWEVSLGRAATQTLLCESDASGTRVLHRSFTSTRMGSLHRNASVSDERFALLLHRCLDRIARGEAIPALWSADPDPVQPPPEELPGLLATLRMLATLAVRFVGRSVEARRFGNSGQRWSIGWRRATPPVDGTFASDAPAEFRFHHAPEGRFYADPFPLEHDGASWIFFEDYDTRNDPHAHLSCVRLDEAGAVAAQHEVLRCAYHLSYPSFFRFDGQLYLLPETASNRTIEAWRPVAFPERWERAQVLIDDIHAADATIFERDGRWWIFAALSPDGGDPIDELHLFFADTPFGRWQPHPANPVVSDVRRARPAGNVVQRDGVWLRPAQDCAGLYGRATRLLRIDVLNEREYAETPIASIEPSSWEGAVRTHTLAHADSADDARTPGWQTIDLSLRRPVGR